MENLKSIIVTTKHRGVFFAQVPHDMDLKATTLTGLKNCRMAIYWGTSKGIMQLAETGPTDSSRISAPADIHVIHDVTAIFDVTEKAAQVWMSK